MGAMATSRRQDTRESELLDAQSVLSPFKDDEWLALSPAERLIRAWSLRSRIADPEGTHDAKLFPAP
jgi:hypothetical protein